MAALRDRTRRRCRLHRSSAVQCRGSLSSSPHRLVLVPWEQRGEPRPRNEVFPGRAVRAGVTAPGLGTWLWPLAPRLPSLRTCPDALCSRCPVRFCSHPVLSDPEVPPHPASLVRPPRGPGLSPCPYGPGAPSTALERRSAAVSGKALGAEPCGRSPGLRAAVLAGRPSPLHARGCHGKDTETSSGRGRTHATAGGASRGLQRDEIQEFFSCTKFWNPLPSCS